MAADPNSGLAVFRVAAAWRSKSTMWSSVKRLRRIARLDTDLHQSLDEWHRDIDCVAITVFPHSSRFAQQPSVDRSPNNDRQTHAQPTSRFCDPPTQRYAP